ncbi:ATP-binding cassette domain-containing protein [Actinopolymorpha alba]|uniref:ATP-binding cassette domain-containing protein n=1 Tax=Actinopolymorpha alba TaxID=533267 RepID=UPI00037D20AF|nr:ATP-binding cassette domain-containing protein [Actinopolymorpha alba]
MRIAAERLSWSVRDKSIVHDVSLDIDSGESVGLIGPNGSGKSSLLRCLAGLRTPVSGTVRYDGEPIRDWDPRRIARLVAFVEQATDSNSDLRVAEVVGLGRTPFRDRWRGPNATDHAVVAAALAQSGLTELATRSWKSLSGGERQRAHIARALAQQPRCLLLDEPTNHLDVRHQLELMELLAATDQTVLVALHDLSLAARFCDRLALMHNGRLVAAGAPKDVLTPERLAEVFEVDAEVGLDSLGNLTVAYQGVAPQAPTRGGVFVDRTATGPALLAQLPPPLPPEQIIELNQPKADLHTTRHHEWNGWTFETPPGVFMPGWTSRMIHDRLLDGRIEVRGRRYAAMGVGVGVEAVAAGVRGAREIYAIDVHPGSVAATIRHYERLVGEHPETSLIPVVGDLFGGLPDGVRLDVITFNPPAVSQIVSDDPAVVRNVCVGASLLARFFAQINDRNLLAPDGEVFLIVSNTADLRAIIRDALGQGFIPEINYLHDWQDGVLTFLFRLTRGGQA